MGSFIVVAVEHSSLLIKEMPVTLLTDDGERSGGTKRMFICNAAGAIDLTKATQLAMLCL